MIWRKSSYSGSSGADGTNGGDCVEVGRPEGGQSAAIRDSKAPQAGYIALDRNQLQELIEGIRAL